MDEILSSATRPPKSRKKGRSFFEVQSGAVSLLLLSLLDVILFFISIFTLKKKKIICYYYKCYYYYVHYRLIRSFAWSRINRSDR